MSVYDGDRVRNLLDPESTIRSIHISAGLGASSAYTWLKLPVVDELERVMDATTLPTLLLGGDPQGDPEHTYAAWGKALDLAAVRGLVVGRALLYPPDGDVAAAVDIAAELVHGCSRRASARAQQVGPAAGQRPARRLRVLVDDTVDGWQHTGLPGPCARGGPTSTPATGSTSSSRSPARSGVRAPSRRHDVQRPARRTLARCSPARPTSPTSRGSRLVLDRGGARPRVAVCAARRDRPAAAVPARGRRRGAGRAARRRPGLPRGPQLRGPAVLDADSMIACEVVTPAGNWSSYPPHKHDEERRRASRPSSRRSTTSRPRSRPARRARRGSCWLPAGLRHRASARSTCSPRCAPATSCWCRTAGTARRWRPPATTCTTST